MENIGIRMLILDNGLKYKDIAYEANMSPEWLSRLLRKELTPENRIRIMGAIERLKNGARNNGKGH